MNNAPYPAEQSAASSRGGNDAFVGDTTLLHVQDFIGEGRAGATNPFNWLLRTFRGKWRVLLQTCAAAAFILAAVAYNMVSPKYESEALIRIAATQPYILYQRDSMQSRHFDAFVMAQVSLLTGPTIMKNTVSNINRDNPTLSMSVPQLESIVAIEQSKSLITIKSKNSDPALAASITDALLDTYLSTHTEANRSKVNYREEELGQREQRLLEKLKTKSQEALKIGGEYGTDSAMSAHLIKIEELEVSAKLIADYNRRIDELDRLGVEGVTLAFDAETAKALVDDDALDEMIYDMTKLQRELVYLEARYQPSQSKVINAKAAIVVLEKAIKQRRESIKSINVDGDTSDTQVSFGKRMQDLQSKRDNYLGIHKRLEQEARILNRKIVELKFVEKESIVLREMLDETRRKLDEIRLESRIDVPGVVEVVSRAQTADSPVIDKRIIFAAIAAVFGAGLVAFVFIVMAVLRPRVRYSDDLLNVHALTPFLGCLDAQENLESDAFGPDFNMNKLRNLIQMSNLQPRSDTRRSKVIAVVGAVQGIECVELAQRVARSFSETGMKTLLVDADISSEELQVSETSGWKELLARESYSVQLSKAGYSVIDRGARVNLRDENVSLGAVREAIAAVSEDYDVIIVNSGVFSVSLSASLIVSESDLTLLATNPNSATATVRKAGSELSQANGGRTRLVLTNADSSDPYFC